ncbi:MAG: hypothetical protein O3A53_17075 [Acidobacteria bacterium]|nr:hypothetical protein [Acidobacteriota bacterium]
MRWTFAVFGMMCIAVATGLAQGPAGPIRPKPQPPTGARQKQLPPVPRIGRQPVEHDREVVAYRPPSDPVLLKAIAANEEFAEKLPNFLCKQFMTRSSSRNLGKKWKEEDVV